MDEHIIKAADILARARATIALTGAGISVESGIPPFRGKGGVWEKFDPFEYAHIDSYHKHPEKIWRVFLLDLVRTLNRAEPNNGHLGLARLEKMNCLQAVITQNVDGMHQAAGNTEVIEFHGSFAWHHCMTCGQAAETGQLDFSVLPPQCQCGGMFRPDCVFFGEQIPLDALNRSHHLSNECDAMLVVGTSAYVQPAASLPEVAKAGGAKIIEINPEPTPYSRHITDVFLRGPAGEVMPRLVSAVQNTRA